MKEITKGTRIINFSIDFICILITYVFLGFFLLTNTNLSIIYYGTYFMYYFLFEFLNQGQTLGKTITKTKIVNYNNKTPSITRILWRTCLRLNPFDALSFLCGQNGHDSVSRTKLISSKKD